MFPVARATYRLHSIISSQVYYRIIRLWTGVSFLLAWVRMAVHVNDFPWLTPTQPKQPKEKSKRARPRYLELAVRALLLGGIFNLVYSMIGLSIGAWRGYLVLGGWDPRYRPAPQYVYNGVLFLFFSYPIQLLISLASLYVVLSLREGKSWSRIPALLIPLICSILEMGRLALYVYSGFLYTEFSVPYLVSFIIPQLVLLTMNSFWAIGVWHFLARPQAIAYLQGYGIGR